MGDLTANFDASEFACKHCGREAISLRLVERLQELRSALGVPLTVLSGYRCPKHPLSVASPTSQHVRGVAADLRSAGPLITFYRYAIPMFLDGGLGLYDEGFLHLDLGPPRTWGRLNGIYCSLAEAEVAIFGGFGT